MRQFSPIILILLTAFVFITACGKQEKDPNTVKVGTITGPETALMEVAKQVAKQRYGLNIKIIEFTDYTMPNAALNDGSIDANMYQHLPYLQTAMQVHGYQLMPLGKTFIYPMAVYSQKISALSQLTTGDLVAIPNDPSNEARALLLLQKAQLITLRDANNVNATPQDITRNPKRLIFKELDAADLPRVLPDVSIAVINTNYAIPAGLIAARDAIFQEDRDSPYANLFVIRRSDKDRKQLKQVLEALRSPEVVAAANNIFKGQAITAWRSQ